MPFNDEKKRNENIGNDWYTLEQMFHIIPFNGGEQSWLLNLFCHGKLINVYVWMVWLLAASRMENLRPKWRIHCDTSYIIKYVH